MKLGRKQDYNELEMSEATLLISAVNIPIQNQQPNQHHQSAEGFYYNISN